MMAAPTFCDVADDSARRRETDLSRERACFGLPLYEALSDNLDEVSNRVAVLAAAQRSSHDDRRVESRVPRPLDSRDCVGAGAVMTAAATSHALSGLPTAPEDRLLTVDEAADVLQISAYVVRQWARERRIPRLGQRYWRFRRSSLDAWIAEQERSVR